MEEESQSEFGQKTGLLWFEINKTSRRFAERLREVTRILLRVRFDLFFFGVIYHCDETAKEAILIHAA